jgi:hypothetical protein
LKDEDGMMNCRRIEELIPLFIEGDLTAEDQQVVSLHVSDCKECSALLDGYGESQNWLRSQTTPEFGDAFYKELQHSVMREINQSRPPSSFFHQLKAGLRLQPRWAMAILLLILGGAFAFYLYSGGVSKGPDANRIVQTTQPKVEPKRQEPQELQPKPQDERKKSLKDLQAVRQPRERFQFKRQRNLKYDLPPVRHDQTNATEVVAQDNLDKGDEKNPINTGETGDANALEEMTRMEFQTADPNIRIIWFAPKSNSSPAVKIDTE